VALNPTGGSSCISAGALPLIKVVAPNPRSSPSPLF